MKNPRADARGLIGWRVAPPQCSSVSSDAAFTESFLPRQLACPADGFGFLARFLDGGFLEMLLELHFPKHALALELFLQGPKGLIDIVVANADLHVVVTTFLS